MYTLFGLAGFSVIFIIGISMLMPMISAQPPALSIPIECEVGTSCFIQNYVDLDKSEGWTDYRCGPNSYNDHKGTDFRLRNLAQMREGVRVLAAADGKILRLRDGEADISIRDSDAAALAGKDCGNGVVIGHHGGYETQYCHMKQNSIAVQKGQVIKRGDMLGEVGLSGNTEFPHLHFQLRNKDSDIIDPFAGNMASASCSAKDYHGHYWQPSAKKALPYVPTALLGMGIIDHQPSAKALRDTGETHTQLPPSADAIILWVDLMGVQQGDRIALSITRPDNVALVSHVSRAKGNKAQWFQFAGKRRSVDAWPEGEYKAYIKLTREADGQSQTIIEQTQPLYVSGIIGQKPTP